MKGITVRMSTKVATLVVAVLLLSGAGGFAVGQYTARAPVPTMPANVTPAPAVTAPVQPMDPSADGAKAGDVLTTFPGTLPGGLLSYLMVDGTYVIVDPAKPLPAVVLADLPLAAATLLGAEGDSPGAHAFTLESLDSASKAQTGRSEVVVFKVVALTGADSKTTAVAWVFWGRDGGKSYQSAPGTREDAIAKANAWAGARDPLKFVVVAVGA